MEMRLENRVVKYSICAVMSAFRHFPTAGVTERWIDVDIIIDFLFTRITVRFERYFFIPR